MASKKKKKVKKKKCWHASMPACQHDQKKKKVKNKPRQKSVGAPPHLDVGGVKYIYGVVLLLLASERKSQTLEKLSERKFFFNTCLYLVRVLRR
jgi:hypothetical protein